MKWEQTFRLAAEGFQRHASADLWHGRILASDFTNPWPLISQHEPLARLRFVGTTGPQGPYRPPDGTGRYFGDRALLRVFRSLADSAVRTLEQSPFADLMSRVCAPPTPRDWSDCWVGLLYCFAEDGVSHLIQAQEREATLFGPFEGEGAVETLRVTMFSFLERDLFTSSVAALTWLLQRDATLCVVIDADACTITIGDEPFTGLDTTIVQLAQVLWENRGNAPMGLAKALESVPSCPHQTTARRKLNRLAQSHPRLRACFDGKSGAGYRFDPSRC